MPGMGREQKRLRELEVAKERGEVADWIMRMLQDYNYISAAHMSDYLQSSLRAITSHGKRQPVSPSVFGYDHSFDAFPAKGGNAKKLERSRSEIGLQRVPSRMATAMMSKVQSGAAKILASTAPRSQTATSRPVGMRGSDSMKRSRSSGARLAASAPSSDQTFAATTRLFHKTEDTARMGTGQSGPTETVKTVGAYGRLRGTLDQEVARAALGRLQGKYSREQRGIGGRRRASGLATSALPPSGGGGDLSTIGVKGRAELYRSWRSTVVPGTGKPKSKKKQKNETNMRKTRGDVAIWFGDNGRYGGAGGVGGDGGTSCEEEDDDNEVDALYAPPQGSTVAADGEEKLFGYAHMTRPPSGVRATKLGRLKHHLESAMGEENIGFVRKRVALAMSHPSDIEAREAGSQSHGRADVLGQRVRSRLGRGTDWDDRGQGHVSDGPSKKAKDLTDLPELAKTPITKSYVGEHLYHALSDLKAADPGSEAIFGRDDYKTIALQQLQTSKKDSYSFIFKRSMDSFR